MLTSNIVYMMFVSSIMFLIYLAYEYIKLRNYYKKLKESVNEENFINIIPEAVNNETWINQKFFREIYSTYFNKITQIEEDKKSNMDFTTAWVHDIKVPIAASKLIIENHHGKPIEDVVYSLEEEVNRIDKYVEKILYHSRVEDFANDYIISTFQLKDFVSKVIRKNANIFINKRIKINLYDLEIEVQSDKKWLTFVIDQIIGNSLKYTSEGGEIEVFSEVKKDGSYLFIKDTGVGIKEEDISRVFSKGFTGYNRKYNEQSTGFGLYLCKRLCEKLGHEIAIESKFGEYTMVKIKFPKYSNYLKVGK